MSIHCTCRGLAALVLIAVAGPAAAQLDTAARKCIDQYNNKARKVSAAQGKVNRACVKDAGRGDEPDPEGCLTADENGKVATAQTSLSTAVTQHCPAPGSLPIVIDAATAGAAHAQGPQGLVHDLFGDDLNTAGLVGAADDDARCRERATLRVGKLFDAQLKEFRKCKKAGMRAGTIDDEASLGAACLDDPVTNGIPDPNGKIAKKAAKLDEDVADDCGGLATPIAQLFPGDCATALTAAELSDCLARRTSCRVCETITAADGAPRDCDDLDDGMANGSCGFTDHLCVVQSTSRFAIHIAALPVPLAFPLNGNVEYRLGNPDPATGVGPARCDDFSFAPINIPCIGFVCLTPVPSCPNGGRDCDGGTALGATVLSDGNVGVCAGNADCQASCDTHCAGLGATATLAGCTGFCSAGSMAACTSDASCMPANGSCHGPNPVTPALAGICQCTCTDVGAGGASPAGALQCRLGVDIDVETSSPCNGTDVLIDVGTTCLPLTTEGASGQIVDANFNPGSTVPAGAPIAIFGAPIACATMDGSVTDFLRTVGVANFFGSALGDLAVGVELNCPGAVGPTATPTRTSTATQTGTVTSTATITLTPSITPTPTVTPPGSTVHTCALAPTSLFRQVFTNPQAVFELPLTGFVEFAVTPPDPGGVGTVSCQGSFDPIAVAPGFILCVEDASSTCPSGARDCDGGTALGADVIGFPNIGPCAGTAACNSACDAHCAGLGRVRVPFGDGCQGHCTGGAMGPCTQDADCHPADGDCANAAASPPGTCQCNCLDAAGGGPGAAGDLGCNLRIRLNVETALPCGDEPPNFFQSMGEGCMALSTQRGRVTRDPGFSPLIDETGSEVSCTDFENGQMAGMRAIAVGNFFDNEFSDGLAELVIDCQ